MTIDIVKNDDQFVFLYESSGGVYYQDTEKLPYWKKKFPSGEASCIKNNCEMIRLVCFKGSRGSHKCLCLKHALEHAPPKGRTQIALKCIPVSDVD